MDDFHRITETAKAISHPGRLKILRTLERGDACVCHMEHLLGYRQAYLSQQLARLKEAGLVIDEREGLNVYYRLADPAVGTLIDSLVTATEAVGKAKLDLALHEKKTGCPCPRCGGACCE